MNTKIKQLKVKGITYDIDVAKDWNQNDPSAVDFIKNKTHYSELKRNTFEWRQEFIDVITPAGSINLYYPLYDGEDYNLFEAVKLNSEIICDITIDGRIHKTLNCVANGSESLPLDYTAENNEESLKIGIVWDEPALQLKLPTLSGIDPAESYTVGLNITVTTSNETVYPLADKYIPETIVRKEDLDTQLAQQNNTIQTLTANIRNKVSKVNGHSGPSVVLTYNDLDSKPFYDERVYPEERVNAIPFDGREFEFTANNYDERVDAYFVEEKTNYEAMQEFITVDWDGESNFLENSTYEGISGIVYGDMSFEQIPYAVVVDGYTIRVYTRELGSHTICCSGQFPYNETHCLAEKFIPDTVARKSDIETAVNSLVDTAPEALNTLNELSKALGDDPNFATTVLNEVGNKVDKVDGKGLSTNDYTTTEKNKLAGIEQGAEKNVQPDWNQFDSTKDDFIRNKTHYKTVGSAVISSIVGTNDDWYGDDNDNNIFADIERGTDYGAQLSPEVITLAKVAVDPVLLNSDISSFNIESFSNDGNINREVSSDYTLIYLSDDIDAEMYDEHAIKGDIAILALKECNITIDFHCYNPANIMDGYVNIHIPSAGLWITHNTEINNVTFGTYEYHTLDEKYIPDTIARNTEVERLVNSLGNLAHDDRYEGEGEDSFKSNNTTQSISKNSFSSGYATIAGAHCFKFAEHDYTQTTTTRIEKAELDDCCKSYLAEQPEEHVAIKSLSPEGFRALVADSQDSGTFTCPYCGNTYEVVYHNTDPGCWSYTNTDEYDLVTISIRSDGSIPMFFYLDGELVDGEELYYEAINRLDEIPVDYDTSTKTGWYYLTSVEGITVDMKYTIVLDNNYDLRGVVLAVDPENNRIQASNYIIPNSSTATTIDEDSYILFPYYPEIGTDTIGTGALAEGFETKALAIASHTEGYATIAAGKYSHAEGRRTIATYSSHAEGWLTEAIGQGSHAEGYKAVSLGDGSHAEGYRTIASGARSHSEGYDTVSSGADSHAEGYLTTSAGDKSHAEGQSTTAEGVYSHSEGRETKALGESSHAEGTKTTASGSNTHAEGYQTNATGDRSHSEGRASTASGFNSHAEGYQTTASGSNSHAEGTTTTASANGSHAEGFTTVASKDYSHAEGYFTTSSGQASHAEGRYTAATSSGAHAEGYQTTASRENSHAEGQSTTIIPAEILGKGNDYILNYWKTNKTLIARGVASHAEGIDTAALGDGSHSEGKETLSRYIGAHSEGISTRAVANAAHSEGTDTRASSANQHAQGRYNIEDTSGKYAHILGNGTSDKRSNAHTIDWDGNAWFAGDVTVGEGKEKLVTETELKASLDKFEPSPSFIASAEAPANTSILWIDTSENGGLKYHNGTDWVTVPVRFS